MAIIMPISELIDDPIKLSNLCHSQEDPIYLTKNGYGDMVVLSIEQYEVLKAKAALNVKLGDKASDEKDRKVEKIEDESSLRTEIQKLPLEDVYDILKEQLDRQHDYGKGKRFL